MEQDFTLDLKTNKMVNHLDAYSEDYFVVLGELDVNISTLLDSQDCRKKDLVHSLTW